MYVWSVLPLALDFREAQVFLGALEAPGPKQTNHLSVIHTYKHTFQHYSLPLSEAKQSNCEADVYVQSHRLEELLQILFTFYSYIITNI